MSPLFWAFILLIIGLAIVVVELFIPSGGLLGIISAVFLVMSVIVAFSHSRTAGFGFVGFVAVAIPTLIAVGIRILPKTPIGRRMFLAAPELEQFDSKTESDRMLSNLMGRIGTTITPLLPAGMTEFDGQRVDTMSEGMAIEAGRPVKVVEVRARKVFVREVDADQVAQPESSDQDLLDSAGWKDDSGTLV